MEGCYPRKASFGGIAVPTNVTLGNCLPSMLCVVDVYLTITKSGKVKKVKVNAIMYIVRPLQNRVNSDYQLKKSCNKDFTKAGWQCCLNVSTCILFQA